MVWRRAPGNTPTEIIGKLNREINAILAELQMKARVASLGSSPLPLSAAKLCKPSGEGNRKVGKVVNSWARVPNATECFQQRRKWRALADEVID
jgi:hypothetical protein